MALTYLAMFSMRPDLADGLARHIAALAGSEGKPAKASAMESRAMSEIAELRRLVDALHGDFNAMRVANAVREERDQAFAARLSAVEARQVADQAMPLTTASISPSSPDARDRTDDERRAGRGGKGGAVDVPVAEVTPPPSPDRTPAGQERSRDGQRVAFGPAQVKTVTSEPAGPRGIQIATGPSVDALRISWMLLSEQHKEILQRYEPRFVHSTGGGTRGYRLIAGPIENTTAANRVCGELRARRVTCGVSAFGGEPL